MKISDLQTHKKTVFDVWLLYFEGGTESDKLELVNILREGRAWI